MKPRLRGVSHQYAFFVALAAGAALVVLARGGEARVAVAVYALSLCAMFGASALYHRIDWPPRPPCTSPRSRSSPSDRRPPYRSLNIAGPWE